MNKGIYNRNHELSNNVKNHHGAQHLLLEQVEKNLENEAKESKTSNEYTGSYITELLKAAVLIFAVEHSEYIKKTQEELLYLLVVFISVQILLYIIQIKIDLFIETDYCKLTPLWVYIKTNICLLIIYYSYLIAHIINSIIQSTEEDEIWVVTKIFSVWIFILLLTIPYPLNKYRIHNQIEKILSKLKSTEKK